MGWRGPTPQPRARGATALVGISPFNGYFTEDRIRDIIAACSRTDREVLVFIPDEVTTHTLEARGYPAARAAKKTRRQLQWLRNKILRAAGSEAPTILGCSELDALPAYRARHAALAQRFETDPAFREGCLATTRWVLAAGPDETVCEQATLHAVQYLLAELPLFLHAPEILGRPEIVFVYHQCPAFVRAIYAEHHGVIISKGQGFVELTARDA